MNNVPPVNDAESIPLSARELAFSSGAPRFELYRAPHKALRYILCTLLVEMGRVSFDDANQANVIMSALAVVLEQCDRHMRHEDDWLRPALVERTPKALATLDREDEQHATHVAELRAMCKAIGAATTDRDRTALGRSLYLHYSVFVAETLAHMAYEERVLQPLIDRHFSVEEQIVINASIVKSVTQDEMMEFLRGTILASSREERFEILNGARAAMSPKDFQVVLADILPMLADADAKNLQQRLGL